MLRVRIDSHEAEVTPISLARMVLDGKVGRHDLTKSSDGAAERPLEYSLEPPHTEALTSELLRRLRAMYGSGGSTDDIDDLRDRVETLCQWHWGAAGPQARFLWAAAWLNELTGRLDVAVNFYDACLQVRCHEPHLRLLAYNNRGVLRLRLGRLEGVGDLVLSAIVTEQGPARLSRSEGLPAACFNLLNLTNVAVRVESLTEVVDEALSEFFVRLPEDVKLLWLGSESTEVADQRGPLPEALSVTRSSLGDGDAESWAEISILRDPTTKRLNRLTSNLATEALRLAPGEMPESSDGVGERACPLLLWTDGADSDVLQKDHDSDQSRCCPRDKPSRYAEAASLLLDGEIPSSLVRCKSPGSQAEQLALEELAEIENLVASGNHELARARLEVQRRILTALNHREHLAGLLGQVDAQLRWIARSERELEQLELQRVCGKLISEIEQFCRLVSLSQAERKIGPIRWELQQHRVQVPAQRGKEVMGLLDELAQRAERHLLRLQRLEVRKQVREPFRVLRRNWPDDWAVPVPDRAYAVLAECHVNDPRGRIHDWAGLKDQLDAHQAQYHLRRALAQLPSDRVSWTEIEAVLVDALNLSPDLWATVAPLFGLLEAHGPEGPPETRKEIRTALESAARRLLGELPGGLQDVGANSPGSLLHHAKTLLARVFRGLHGDARRFVRLWRSLEKTLSPVLLDGTEELIGEVEAIATTCLDHWPVGGKKTPTRNDPRNPVRIFLESCERSRCLAEAERLLNGPSSSPQKARKCFSRALGLGLETVDQLRRAATGIYLAESGQEDAPRVQRQVLDRLDAWAEGMETDGERLVGEEMITQVLAALKVDVLADRTMPGTDEPASDESQCRSDGSDSRTPAVEPPEV